MMTQPSTTIDLDGAGLALSARLVPWDTEVFGFPVAQIHDIRVKDSSDCAEAWRLFRQWLCSHGVRVVSCRLPMDRLRESFSLEEQGFRFIEVVLHPYYSTLDDVPNQVDTIDILPAELADMPNLLDIAERAFRYERYHVDPRIDPELGRRRYARWVRTSFGHPSQQLLKILDGKQMIGFFVIEQQTTGPVYWHLNAISPEFQGRGYGRRVWQAMLQRHRGDGATAVSTTISARNIVVQNLYAQLGFRFLPPEMTFHWIQ